ncbi:M23 family metallopeptidase [Streptomyces sp. NPDC052052]|uniref:M23 family metallopeptidase n=1 Tax=Streptomyces sp. NPDC052052 TaxID=3154756 RepID=UPI00342AA5D6
MAFTRATGKHRAPSRLTSRSARVVGIAALATTGVLGGTAAPALAADSSAAETGLSQVLAVDSTLAEQIEAQADAQQRQADAEAKKKAEADAKRAAQARAEKARAARSAERARLNAFRLPVAGSYVTTGYRTGGALWSSGRHSGIDFHAAYGSSVVAVGAGTVVEAGWGGAYGNNIVLRMTDGTYTQYGHLSSIGVFVGQRVGAGQRIGFSGSTGNSTGPHLHFEARTTPSYGSDLNPIAYLRARGVNV